MRLILSLLVLCVFTLGSGLAEQKEDLVVFGKLDHQEYMGSLDDLGLNGCIEAQLRITRIVKGRPPSRTLKVRYIAHGFRSEDRAVRFRLRRNDDGVYLVCSGNGERGYICN